MSNQVMLNLSDTTYQHAQYLAKLTRRDVNDVLVDTIELSLPSLHPTNGHTTSVTALTDDALLTLIESQLDKNDDARLSVLLYKQREGELVYSEKHELERLMQLYQGGLLRKAEALAEAVRRGIHEPLIP